MGDEDEEGGKEAGLKTRDGHEQPGGQIKQRAMRGRDEVKGKLKDWLACRKMT